MKLPPIQKLSTYPCEFMTPQAIADHLGLDPRTVLRMIADGELSATKAGRQWRLHTASVRQRFGGVVSRETSSTSIEQH